MAAKRSRVRSNGKTGPRGPRGKTGPAGPAGPPGDGEVAKLAAQVNAVVKELQTQLTRIGQIQMQLDRFASGQSPEPEGEPPKRTDH